MIAFVNAKINLGLQVTERRPDGYHLLQTIFYPVGLHAGTPRNPESFCDALEIIRHPANKNISTAVIDFQQSGRWINCPVEKNLAYRAASLYIEKFNPPPALFQIRLSKHLPDGAGMGGGSADASFTLRLMREIHALNLNRQFDRSLPSDTELAEAALQLGADCPFFIYNRPAFATGIGENLQPIDLDLGGKWLVVVKPDVSISTAEAFGGITPRTPEFDLRQIVELPIEQWRDVTFNDFEIPFFVKFPEMRRIKADLYESGALYASLTGSGSCFYGIYEDQSSAEVAKMRFEIQPTIQAVYLLLL